MWERRNQFANWDRSKQNGLILGIFKLLDSHSVYCFTVKLPMREFQEVYRAPPDHRKIALDSAYGLCFRTVISFVPELTQQLLRRTDITVNFVVDQGHRNAGAAANILELIRKERISGISETLGAVTLAKSKDHPGLQGADGLVASAHQWDHALPPMDIEPGYSLTDARSLSWVRSPPFRVQVTEAVMRELREGLLARIEVRRQTYLARKAAKASC